MVNYKKQNGSSYMQRRREQMGNTFSEDQELLELDKAPESKKKDSTENTEIAVSDIENQPSLGNDTGVLPPNKEITKEEDTESENQMNGEDESPRVGRPKKFKKIIRNNPKTIKFDDETSKRLLYIRADHKFDLQDIVFIAVKEFLDKYFPMKGKPKAEDIAYIRQLIAELYKENSSKLKIK